MGKKKVVYLGQVGFGNLGDDFCAQLIRSYIGSRVKVEWKELIPTHALNDESVYEADLVLFGGGTLFDFRENDAVQAAYKYRQQHVVIFGSGVQDFADGPMTGDGYTALARVGRAAAWIGVRGPVSLTCFALAGQNKVYLTGDPIFLYEPKRQRQAGASRRVALQFGLPSHSFPSCQSLAQEIFFIAKNLREQDWKPDLLSVWGRDLDYLERVNRQFGMDLPIVAPDSYQDMVEAFADYEFSITNRLHGGLASLLVGCPTVMVAHQTKTYDAALLLGWKIFFPCDFLPTDRVVGVATQLAGMDMEHYLGRIENFRQAQRKYLDGIVHDFLSD